MSELAAESAFVSLKRSRILFDTGNPASVFIPSATVTNKDRRRRLKGAHEINTEPIRNEYSRALVASNATQESSSRLKQSVTSDLARFSDSHNHNETYADESRILVRSNNKETNIPNPQWHAPWKLSTVLSSHLGWVRSIAMDPFNNLFATGSADRTIKIWNFPKASVGADDALRLTLTGHISPVRGLAFSARHPYLFSCAEDKMVKCWDLETNQVVRHYHGHLSGVCCLRLHPTLDLLVTGGRDAVARVWDIRTKTAVHVLSGHDNTVASLLVHATHPQVVTGSHDTTIKLWDLIAGKTVTTLTHHSKSVRALVSAASLKMENTFCSGAPDSIRKWQAKDGRFLQKMTGHNAIVNAMALNDDGVLVSGGDDGSMRFWDYKTGYNFQSAQAQVQPGSLEAENGIMAMEFDLTGTRLITGETDKTIKIWKQDDNASELSHPIDMPSWRKKCIAEAKRRY
jgi:pleiotropic regulator 1